MLKSFLFFIFSLMSLFSMERDEITRDELYIRLLDIYQNLTDLSHHFTEEEIRQATTCKTLDLGLAYLIGIYEGKRGISPEPIVAHHPNPRGFFGGFFREDRNNLERGEYDFQRAIALSLQNDHRIVGQLIAQFNSEFNTDKRHNFFLRDELEEAKNAEVKVRGQGFITLCTKVWHRKATLQEGRGEEKIENRNAFLSSLEKIVIQHGELSQSSEMQEIEQTRKIREQQEFIDKMNNKKVQDTRDLETVIRKHEYFITCFLFARGQLYNPEEDRENKTLKEIFGILNYFDVDILEEVCNKYHDEFLRSSQDEKGKTRSQEIIYIKRLAFLAGIKAEENSFDENDNLKRFQKMNELIEKNNSIMGRINQGKVLFEKLNEEKIISKEQKNLVNIASSSIPKEFFLIKEDVDAFREFKSRQQVIIQKQNDMLMQEQEENDRRKKETEEKKRKPLPKAYLLGGDIKQAFGAEAVKVNEWQKELDMLGEQKELKENQDREKIKKEEQEKKDTFQSLFFDEDFPTEDLNNRFNAILNQNYQEGDYLFKYMPIKFFHRYAVIGSCSGLLLGAVVSYKINNKLFKSFVVLSFSALGFLCGRQIAKESKIKQLKQIFPENKEWLYSN